MISSKQSDHYPASCIKSTNTDVLDSYTSYLPEKLKEMVVALRSVPDDRLRYQQLLFLATKCAPMPTEFKTQENKVPGCLSTVHVHATISAEGKVRYVGDSDAQLTKGLVAILVEGLSESTPAEIERVQPDFIQFAGVGASLTPGRNNGFLNMLQLMKLKAKRLAPVEPHSSSEHKELIREDSNASERQADASRVSLESYGATPIYNSMVTKLSLLKPVELTIKDESYKHAGHAGMNGVSSNGETHFNVRIIAACFEGLSLVQRHKMVYTLLAKEMAGGIHALSIYAKTPNEEAASGKK